MQLKIRLDLTPALPMNMNREGNLLTPALSSTSVWRRGRWNGARGFWGSLREILRRILSPRRGNKMALRWQKALHSSPSRWLAQLLPLLGAEHYPQIFRRVCTM
jgi:hypothetical protein